MTATYDIAIIGAGPAGTATALALHESGLRVALIDKATFPRDKICGDAVPCQAFKAMDLINPEWGQKMRQISSRTDIKTSTLFLPHAKPLSINWVLPAFNCKRINFDNFLFQLVRNETNTEVIENKKLENISKEEDGLNCHFQDGFCLKAKVLIGCDGANSVVRKQLDKKDQNTERITAVRTYYYGIKGLKPGVNEFHLLKDLFPGYLWIFSVDSGLANVGIGLLQGAKKRSKKNIKLSDVLKDIPTTIPSLAERFQDAKIQDRIKAFVLPVGTRRNRISGHRFLLCGDAAALVDPLQGHGVDKAIWSGMIAAKQAVRIINSNDFSQKSMKQYDKLLYKKLGAELSRNTLILRLISKFPCLLLSIPKLGSSSKLLQGFVRTIKI